MRQLLAEDVEEITIIDKETNKILAQITNQTNAKCENVIQASNVIIKVKPNDKGLKEKQWKKQ